MKTYGLVDERNNHLWNELNKVYTIDIQFEDRAEYAAYSKNEEATIYIPNNKIDSASFTHELLHIYLRTKEIYIGSGLKLFIKENQNLSMIFSDRLLEHIGNCLDHMKMLPEFLKLGYERNNFISDYSKNKLTVEELSEIKLYFLSPGLFGVTYNSTAIDSFIGKFFAAKACPDDSRNYNNELAELKSVDSNLYSILDKFIIAWHNFDINDNDPITGDYHSMLFEFVDDLETWTIGKKIK